MRESSLLPRTILIVEDSPLIRDLYRAVLEAEGYRVLIAEDGIAGLEAALRHAPHLLVVDMVMPGLDGLEMIDALRACERERGRSAVPALLLSANTALPVNDPSRLGIRALLEKGRLTPQKIVAAVRAHAGPPKG